MRVFFLVVLMLAGCANTTKTVSNGTSGSLSHEKNRTGEPAPAADIFQQPQQPKPQILQKSQPQQMKNGWIDISGNGRDDSGLFQDSAACQSVYQQALATAWQLYPEHRAGDCPDCGTLNAKAVILRQQNVSNYANTAYTNCMEAKGWRKQ